MSEFRIYEDILMTPDMTKLPWDPNHKENHDYQLTYKVQIKYSSTETKVGQVKIYE